MTEAATITKSARKAGRPRKISSVEEFEALAESYFQHCEETGKPLTVTGLAWSIGLSSREALMEYEKREEFSYSVKRAKSRIECYYEELLTTAKNPAGAIFALKNFGWTDKATICHEGEVNISLAQSIEAARLRVAGQ